MTETMSIEEFKDLKPILKGGRHKKNKAQPEYLLQVAVCDYLRKQHSGVYFLSDTVAQLYLKPPQRMRNAKIQNSNFHCPDIIIFEAKKGFHACLIELKTETPYRKDGQIKASDKDHLLKQQKTINELNRLGYFAAFAWSYEMAVEIIDNYLK